MRSTLATVFNLRRPQYILLALLVMGIVFSIALLYPNKGLLLNVLTSNTMGISAKISFLWSFYGAIGTNFTAFSAAYTTSIAVLFGINAALITYYIRRQRTVFKGAPPMFGAGIGGLIAGFLGIGCAACGTFVLTTLLTLVGAGALLTALPLKGQEFGLLGVGLLLYSIYALLGKMQEPMATCSIKITK